MKIVTIANHRPTAPYYMYDEFFASCRRFGHEPIVLSEGYGGLGTKPVMLRQAIEAGKIEDDYIIFCDCFDVLFQDDPALALERFQHVKPAHARILWNAEKTCFPEPRFAEEFPPSPTAHRYLNSGFAVGETQAFYNAIEEMDLRGFGTLRADKKWADGSWDNPNDQLFWQRQFLYGSVPMALDVLSEVCQTTHAVTEEELDFTTTGIKNAFTKFAPVALHLNGQKEIWKDRMIKHLGL